MSRLSLQLCVVFSVVLLQIPMEPTVQGIRDGKDELLEKAIEILK